jgi:N-acylneuraminate cytidylyltransferase
MKILYLIPARKGSKGLPDKNVKVLGNKPLIAYTIDFALKNIKEGDELCISTNDDKVLEIVTDLGINVPFRRPAELATDEANSYDVIMHALKHYENIEKFFDVVLLLQPTSPLRSQDDFDNLIKEYSDSIDMIVSVKMVKDNPYFNLFEEDNLGFLEKSKKGNFQRRQDVPSVFAFNGSMYLMNVDSLKKMAIGNFKKIRKVVMPDERSVDIDTFADWILAEFYLNKIRLKNLKYKI